MRILLKNCLIVDPGSPFHNYTKDIFVLDGTISQQDPIDVDQVFDLNGKMVSCGWFDLSAQFHDPGNENKEDMESGIACAISGGFTDVHLIPDTEPPIDSKAEVEYLIRQSQKAQIHVSGSLTKQLDGVSLNDILDLKRAGAVSVSEGDGSIQNSELFLKALQYTSQVEMPIFQVPRDEMLAKFSQMHQGYFSTLLGLRAEPSLSEVLCIKRDLEILRYSGGRLHFSRLSTEKGVRLVSEAKAEGLNVTADVALHQLIFTDRSIAEFDTNYKVQPPYREEADRLALISGVKDGTIDAICSNHRPQDLDQKELEFDLAGFGNISLQTFFPTLLKLTGEVPIETLIERITIGPRKILGLPKVQIKHGMPAKITAFDPDIEWSLNAETNLSRSKNSPFWEQDLKGKVLGVVNGTYFSFEG
ncbi:MAG: dihydroorotase [Bacteroidota bacterium]